MNIRKRIISAGASLVLAAGLGFALTQPAAATTGYICNHKNSDEWIMVARGDGYGNEYVPPGDCAYYLQMEGTRVDVDTTGTWSDGVDVDSYQLIYSGSRHPCHNGETNDSDPPNISGGVTYETWTSWGCPLPHP